MTGQLTPGQVAELPIGKLAPDPDQPRSSFDEASLLQLAESLKRRVHVPLLVRPGAKGKWIIVDGERRWRAAKLAKLKTLPVLLAGEDTGDDDRCLDQVAVNQLREQLKPMEVARLLARMRATQFATDNDLAAALEKRGLPAMTPKQIAESVELTELPDWAQAMVDEGTLEASAAARIRTMLPWPKALADVGSFLESRIHWTGRVTDGDVISVLRSVAREYGRDLTLTEHWHSSSVNVVHFNPKTVCKGCEKRVDLGRDGRYCMDPAEFERKNAEAKAAGLLPGGKKPQKAKAGAAPEPEEAEVKAEKRAQTLEEKARDYLHAYLVRRIIVHMRGDVGRPGTQIDICDELLIWRAMRRPGEHSYGSRPSILTHQGAEAAGVKSLEWLLASKDLDEPKLEAAVEVATELKWRETQVVCHQLWGTAIELVWEMDEDFVKLFRKAELVQLATVHQLDPPEGKTWEKLKASDLRAEILARADQVRRPTLLQDIYQAVEDPYHGGWMGWDEEDDEDLEEDAA